MDRPALVGFFSELEKIAATVLMKALKPEAKAFMKRMTGFGRQAKAKAPVKGVLSPQATRKSFAGSRKEIAEEAKKLPGMTDADRDVRAVKEMASKRRGDLDEFLKRTGRTSSSPGLEGQLSRIGGHPRQITRTPARVVRQEGTSAGGTVAHKPSAKASQQGTVAARPSARRPRPTMPAPDALPRSVTGLEPTVALR